MQEDINMNRCFADVEERLCSVLKKKNCVECNFFKTLKDAIDGLEDYDPEPGQYRKRKLLEMWGVRQGGAK